MQLAPRPTDLVAAKHSESENMAPYKSPDGPIDYNAELDLTNEHLATLETTELKDTLQHLDLTANRLKEVEQRILALPKLQYLSLRQNLLTDVSAFSEAACKGTLRELMFNDNQLKEMPCLEGCTALNRLDFSYNEVRSLQPLEALITDSLEELFCAVNKIPEIVGISHLTTLQTLELGSNRLTRIQGLESLVNLNQLWLGRNRISEITNLSTLTNLRQISLQANRLESMQGVGVLTHLEELYLSQNGITAMVDLAPLTNLKILDLAQNRITKVENLESQTLLTDLWLNDNPLGDLDHLEAALVACKETLTTVYFQNTPAAKTPAYLLSMRQLLPNLEYVDSVVVQR